MSEKIKPGLNQVPETLMLTLHARAREAERKDALFKDTRAIKMVERLDYDFKKNRLGKHDETSIVFRVLKYDAFVTAFLARHPDGVVVHIGCGLDTRFERTENGRVEWFDIDLPEVVALRRQLMEIDSPRYHLLSASILGEDWIAPVRVACTPHRAILFVAEGVLPYFEESQVRGLFLKIRDCFPGAEMVCDGHSPFTIWADNLQLAYARFGARMHWGMKDPQDLESWGEGICLLERWYYFDKPDPRWGVFQWLKYTPMAHSAGVFHYQLGVAAS